MLVQLLAAAHPLYEAFRSEFLEIFDMPDLLAAEHQMGTQHDWPLAAHAGPAPLRKPLSAWLTQERAQVLLRVGSAVRNRCELNLGQAAAAGLGQPSFARR